MGSIKRRIPLLIASGFVLVVVYAGFIGMRSMQLIVPHDGMMPPSAKSCLLEGVAGNDAGDAPRVIDYLVHVDDRPYDVIVIGGKAFEFTLHGVVLRSPEDQQINLNQSLIEVPETGEGALHFSYVSEGANRASPRVFLVERSYADELFQLSRDLRMICLGALLALALYSLVLFLSKRTERYLLSSFMYAILLFLWVLLLFAHPPAAYSDTLALARQFLNITTLLLSLHIGCELLSLPLPQCLRTFLATPRYIIAVGLISLIISSMFEMGLIVLQYFWAVATIGVGLFALLRIQRKNFALTTVFFLTQVMRANSSLFLFLSLNDSLWYSLFVTAPAFDLPCLLGYMIAINKKFAKKFEDAEDLAARLDEKVELRTRQLQLQQAQKHQLMLNVFHDLRSPLFVLSHIVQSGEKDDRALVEHLPVLKERVSFMTSLVNDLFMIAKLEIGKVLFSSDVIDLGKLLEDVVAAPRVNSAGETIAIELRSVEDCRVEGDRVRLSQAFGNLVDNAAAYSEETPVQVTMAIDAEHASINVFVADSGPGLTEEEIAMVFDQYYCKDRSSTSKSTGLGLSIARSVILHHEGTIRVESTVGQGTTFIVSLPLL
ncbi:cell wall metabolism sensor histidine kinase WalK [Eggerthella sp. YY7918]|uniref:sensor histidine kinase n=1 Tax=Eggerthella sp. (strain YY7918) TaxID=502558 RepID=UPI00021718F5|nr:HAMP domain-containing sensor histidine kinase [Eggerthella sp. YY7918]BAK45702.1 signal transduction histidine kinase [Eggerthella sp. YY7918]